jgi:transcriptional regulator with GAF, ATPase, and Fis domain
MASHNITAENLPGLLQRHITLAAVARIHNISYNALCVAAHRWGIRDDNQNRRRYGGVLGRKTQHQHALSDLDIMNALKKHDGSQSQAAKSLGLPSATLRSRVHRVPRLRQFLQSLQGK